MLFNYISSIFILFFFLRSTRTNKSPVVPIEIAPCDIHFGKYETTHKQICSELFVNPTTKEHTKADTKKYTKARLQFTIADELLSKFSELAVQRLRTRSREVCSLYSFESRRSWEKVCSLYSLESRLPNYSRRGVSDRGGGGEGPRNY